MTNEQRIELWEAVNEYARTCGGHTGDRPKAGPIISAERQRAVVLVERAVHRALTATGPGSGAAEPDKTVTVWEHKNTMGSWDVCECPGDCDARARRPVSFVICGRCGHAARSGVETDPAAPQTDHRAAPATSGFPEPAPGELGFRKGLGATPPSGSPPGAAEATMIFPYGPPHKNRCGCDFGLAATCGTRAEFIECGCVCHRGPAPAESKR